MIAIRGLAAAAMIGVGAIAFAPRAAALTETSSLEFRHHADRSALDNYRGILREAKRACAVTRARDLALRVDARACVDNVMARLLAAMGREDLALLDHHRTGRPDDSSRMLAGR